MSSADFDETMVEQRYTKLVEPQIQLLDDSFEARERLIELLDETVAELREECDE